MELHDYRPAPKRCSRPTKKERRLIEIYETINGRWDQGSADEILELASEFFSDHFDGG